MRTLLATLLLLAGSLITAATPVIAQVQAAPSSICSSTQLPGTLTFTVCASKSTLHVNQPATITMSMTNISPGNEFFYSTRLDIINNGNTVFSASQNCPAQFSCPVASGQTRTITFTWITTTPVGTDTIQGTLIWDVGCRILGCLVASPLPVITAVSVTVK